MATGSAIEWTDATWNPVAGCTPVSPGCRNCYAARMALRLSRMSNGTGEKYKGTASKTRGGVPVFTGQINLDYDALQIPRRWRSPSLRPNLGILFSSPRFVPVGSTNDPCSVGGATTMPLPGSKSRLATTRLWFTRI